MFSLFSDTVTSIRKSTKMAKIFYKSKMFIVSLFSLTIRVITKLLNSEQSYKGKVKTHKYINRQNQSTTAKL
jgi:hypothetical protein